MVFISEEMIKLFKIIMEKVDEPLKNTFQFRPLRAYNSPFFTTNSGPLVWNNNSSLTLRSRGPSSLKIIIWRRNLPILTENAFQNELFMLQA